MAKVKIDIVGDASSAERAFKQAGKAASGFGSKMGMLAKGGLIAGAAAATYGLAKGLKSSVQAAMEAEKVQAALAAQMKASGQAFDDNIGRINKQVDALSRLSGFDDEALTGAFTRMVRATGDTSKALNQMGLVADFARARNIDVAASADIIAKVMAGNTGILGRYGIQLEKGTTATEALGIMQQRVAGQAEAYGKTTAGAQDRVKVSLENVQESIGAKLLPAFNQMLLWASGQLPKIEAFFNTHGGSIRKVLDGIGSFIRTVWVPIFNTGREIAQSMIAGVRKFMDQHGTEVERIFGRIVAAVKASAAVMQFLAEKVVAPILKPVFQSVLPTVLGITVTAIDKVTGAIGKLIEAVKWLGSKAGALIGKFSEAVKGPAQAAASALGPLNSVVNSIVRAIDGIIGRVESLARAASRISSIAGGLIGKIPGMATGGPVSAGQAYVVGEKGPELFVPGSNGTIVPNTSTPSRAPSMTGGAGGTVINVSLPNYLGSPTEVAQVIRQELIKIGRNNAGNVFAGVA